MKKSHVIALILASVVIGYIVMPTVVTAATNLVVVKDSKTNNKARVRQGSLWVNSSGSLAYTAPWGGEVIAEGTGNPADVGTSFGILTGIQASDAGLAVTADTDCNGTGGNDLWTSTATDTSIQFEGGVSYCGPLSVSGATGQWFLYGDAEGGLGTFSQTNRSSGALKSGLPKFPNT